MKNRGKAMDRETGDRKGGFAGKETPLIDIVVCHGIKIFTTASVWP